MKKKYWVGIIVAMFLLGNATGAWAGSAWKEVKALFNPSLKVELNGQEIDGVKALQYNGSLYLPAKSVSDYFGLNSKLVFDNKANKLIIGGPMYVHLYDKDTANFFQIVINGNWRPSVMTDNRNLYSNYYMGVDFRLESEKGLSLDEYVKQALKNAFEYVKVNKQTNTKVAGAEAQVIDYETSDTVGKLVFIQKDSSFATLLFFVDRTRYQDKDLKEYDKIISSFNIK
ncbi:hypothetical protein SAMN04487969_107131 [Paenibacillus algorifonticola]|uniref:Copper amine oxidase N-terminal domain-containing protein n=1 Tax=Paenibacillus algorifonticola TaxID=684063 RepID=A0A1I2DPI5_9BACL|nr:hypothetical protein [Paenibacillus algorifonticola]SFE82241.1 hypothetical protein SAMN04487969_107131 [Paenibacillus algorifonticola]